MDGQYNESATTTMPTSSRSYLQPIAAFWWAIAIGAALRIYCVVFTNGTGDMDDWEDHAQQVHDRGLIGYYHANSFANHPPFISKVSALILQMSAATGIPFRILFRTPFALLDAGNALLLFLLLPENRWRFFAAACYWLSPAAILISAYHGNTDTAIAFFILLSVWLATKQRIVSSGAALGASLWVKLPGILALPALLIMLRRRRLRGVFLVAAAVVALLTYLPSRRHADASVRVPVERTGLDEVEQVDAAGRHPAAGVCRYVGAVHRQVRAGLRKGGRSAVGPKRFTLLHLHPDSGLAGEISPPDPIPS